MGDAGLGDPPRSHGRRVFFGGGVSFTFGTLTRVSVSPLVGYQISRMYSVGAQLSYDYVRQEVEARDRRCRSSSLRHHALLLPNHSRRLETQQVDTRS